MNRLKKVALAAGGTLTGYTLVQEVRNRVSRRNPIEELNRTLLGGVESVANALYQSTGFEMTEGNQLSWYNDAAIFDGLREAIDGARESIHVDTYIWKEGRTGEALVQQVLAAARRGVKVRVMVDPLGSENFEKVFCPRLLDARCEVLYFRPPRLKPLKAWGRNHRKLVIVDSRVAFTGGFGVGDEWLEWRDANVRVEGPVVRQMQQAFAAHWLEVGGGLLPSQALPHAQPIGSTRACFVTSTDVKGHSNAHWVTSISIAAAQRQLWIANAYFMPPPTLIDLLADRASAGVDVRVLLPGKHIDHFWMRALQKARYGSLRGRGVRLFEYEPSMMHAKTALVDGRLVVVGSINLDLLSQEVLEEGALVIDDPQVAQQLQSQWELDLSRAKEVRPARGGRVDGGVG